MKTNNFPLEDDKKKKNEEIIFNILKKSETEKVVESVMLNFFFSQKNKFNINNEELKNFIINEYIYHKNDNIFNNNQFILLCNYINENKEHNFKIENKDVSINFLSLLIKQKNKIENQLYQNIHSESNLSMIDSLIERTNKFIENELSKKNEQIKSKKIKI